ncbi:MAG TPA: hypothetical protein VLT33_32300, partial [Labilithrix sp.]|nr:hypothetical protein [Labilithrix sp.]
ISASPNDTLPQAPPQFGQPSDVSYRTTQPAPLPSRQGLTEPLAQARAVPEVGSTLPSPAEPPPVDRQARTRTVPDVVKVVRKPRTDTGPLSVREDAPRSANAATGTRESEELGDHQVRTGDGVALPRVEPSRPSRPASAPKRSESRRQLGAFALTLLIVTVSGVLLVLRREGATRTVSPAASALASEQPASLPTVIAQPTTLATPDAAVPSAEIAEASASEAPPAPSAEPAAKPVVTRAKPVPAKAAVTRTPAPAKSLDPSTIGF